MEITKDRYYVFCEKHKKVVDGVDGVLQEHKDGERCDWRKCQAVGAWEFFKGARLES